LMPVLKLATLANAHAASTRAAAVPSLDTLPHSCFDPSLETLVFLGRIMTHGLSIIEDAMMILDADAADVKVRAAGEVGLAQTSGSILASVLGLTLVNLRASPG
jgi:hypothetical protein